MKKVFITLFIVFSAVMPGLTQMVNGGFHRGGTSTEMNATIKRQLKAELNLTDAQTDAVAMTYKEYQLKMQSIKMETNANTEEEMQSQINSLEAARRQKLKTVLNDQQIEMFEHFIENKKVIASKGI